MNKNILTIILTIRGAYTKSTGSRKKSLILSKKKNAKTQLIVNQGINNQYLFQCCSKCYFCPSVLSDNNLLSKQEHSQSYQHQHLFIQETFQRPEERNFFENVYQKHILNAMNFPKSSCDTEGDEQYFSINVSNKIQVLQDNDHIYLHKNLYSNPHLDAFLYLWYMALIHSALINESLGITSRVSSASTIIFMF